MRFSRRPLPGTQSADSGTCTSMVFILLIRNQIFVDSQAAERRGIFESQLWRETSSQGMQNNWEASNHKDGIGEWGGCWVLGAGFWVLGAGWGSISSAEHVYAGYFIFILQWWLCDLWLRLVAL